MGRGWGLGLFGAVMMLSACATPGAGGTTTGRTIGRGIEKDELNAFFRMHTDEITLCYAQQVRYDSSLRGDVVARFIITPGHRATSITAVQNTTGSERMWRCMRNVIASWSFPFENDQDVIVEQPFSFDSAGLQHRM
jgi:hypothetical protein